ncbi:MAG: hypothetical protein R6U13_05315, partial [Desulfatiglandaceae bacterium]
TLGAIFLVSGLSSNFGFSPLLANMVMGVIIINKVKHADDLFHVVIDVPSVSASVSAVFAGIAINSE